MSISFAGLNAQAYVGQPFSQPMQIAGVSGRAVKLSIDWLAYGAGNDTPDILITANCQAGAASNQVALLDLVRSIYKGANQMRQVLLAIVPLAILLSAPAAHAQQLPYSQTALQIDNVVNQWAQMLEADQKQIADLQKQVADLKAKYEPAKADKK